MKFRRTFRLHGLRRANMYVPFVSYKTFFQQKWIAKALARGYHGEHIKERQWERMFSRRLASVVNMQPQYMAQHDGAEQAAGRGRGINPGPGQRVPSQEAKNELGRRLTTPYMHMTFAPMERRLDIAVFRALFASSARQARQFVVHGAVTVNGKKMIYPGYLLNPGDLFQVDVERVLYATGAKKPTRRVEMRKWLAKTAEAKKQQASTNNEETEAAGSEDDAAAAADAPGKEDSDPATDAAANKAAKAAARRQREVTRELPYLGARIKWLLTDASQDMTVWHKKELRRFVRSARKWLIKAGVYTDAETTAIRTGMNAMLPLQPSPDVIDHLADLLNALPALDEQQGQDKTKTEGDAAGPVESGKPKKEKKRVVITAEDRARFRALLERDAENPIDRTKPYATPWRPRPYMAPFVFIPQYLEVNQNICAAVYLRHPVARPGHAEVPTPFPIDINQLAFNWYLRRH
ncbi:30S ribosomal subunit [Niveomyces insectorum RCEF 264]|uniref:Small ribosomal subunit protein uS4m n=1 Tax=Niveomyces insectorum RCEF 264 TaxID=1081102 RepID=A0A162J623_9HYPO|nr:30S ribosomal subunit [Niveomyces insectorum RCEF 264]